MNAELHFDPESHVYTFKGIKRPGVTGILEAEGFLDYSFLGADAPYYLERGRAVHSAIEFEDEDRLDWDTLDDSLKGYVEAWRDFKRAIGVTMLEIERPVFHPWYGYAGTPDRIVKINRATTVIDVKSGPVAPWTGVQTAAYSAAWSKMNGVDPESLDRMAVQVSQDGTFKVTRFKDHAGDISAFLAAVTCYNWKLKNGVKRRT